MAHFSKISETNVVLNVVVVSDNDCLDINGLESETVGQEFLENCANWPKHLWIQTSINTYENKHALGGTPFRGNYGMTGSEWDPTNNIFWQAKPHASWVKNISKAKWESPIGDAPAITSEQENDTENRHFYLWNEETQVWDYGTSPVKTL